MASYKSPPPEKAGGAAARGRRLELLGHWGTRQIASALGADLYFTRSGASERRGIHLNLLVSSQIRKNIYSGVHFSSLI